MKRQICETNSIACRSWINSQIDCVRFEKSHGFVELPPYYLKYDLQKKIFPKEEYGGFNFFTVYLPKMRNNNFPK